MCVITLVQSHRFNSIPSANPEYLECSMRWWYLLLYIIYQYMTLYMYSYQCVHGLYYLLFSLMWWPPSRQSSSQMHQPDCHDTAWHTPQTPAGNNMCALWWRHGPIMKNRGSLYCAHMLYWLLHHVTSVYTYKAADKLWRLLLHYHLTWYMARGWCGCWRNINIAEYEVN